MRGLIPVQVLPAAVEGQSRTGQHHFVENVARLSIRVRACLPVDTVTPDIKGLRPAQQLIVVVGLLGLGDGALAIRL